MMRGALILLVLCAALQAAAQSVVTLRPTARVAPGTALTIGDVAGVTGDEGLGLIGLAARARITTSTRVTVAEIRAALDAAGIRTADVAVRGSVCEVVVRRPRAPTEAGPTLAATEPAADATDPGSTLEAHVRHRIRLSLGLPAERIEMRFEPDDADLLATPTHGQTVEVRVTGFSRRTPVRITMYGADGTVRDESLRVGVRVQRPIARAARNLPRGERLDASDLIGETQWVEPDSPALPMDEAIGVQTRRGIDTGQVLTRGDVESPLAVQEGDVVIVHVAHGTVVLRREARALADGRIGDTIEFAPLTASRGDRGAAFRARVDRPGRAVIVVPRRDEPVSSDTPAFRTEHTR